MAHWAYYNNDFVPETDCVVPAGDLAVQRGYGLFDFFKTRNGKPVFLEAHLARFYQSAAALGLKVVQTTSQLKAILFVLLEKNNLADSGVRLTLTGGVSPDAFTTASPNLIITQQSLQLPSQALFEQGLKLATYAHERQLPHIKTIDYLMAIWLQPWLAQQGADDVLYYSDTGVSECPRANFFIVTEAGTVVTPAQGVLKGITRAQILRLAGGAVEERAIRVEELKTAREVFITSTTKGVLPVIAIDRVAIGTGKPGPVTRRLAEQVAAAVQQEVLHETLKVYG